VNFASFFISGEKGAGFSLLRVPYYLFNHQKNKYFFKKFPYLLTGEMDKACFACLIFS